MMKVVWQADGEFAVHEIGGTNPNDVLAVFSTRTEADEWMFSRTLTDDLDSNGLCTLRPGEGQSIS